MRKGFADEAEDLERPDGEVVSDYLQAYLQQVVSLHMAMFQKLLFDSDGVPAELAELFEDVGRTYLDLSESISRHHLQRRLSQVEEQLDAGIEPALRRVEAHLGIEPGVRRAEHFAKPVED